MEEGIIIEFTEAYDSFLDHHSKTSRDERSHRISEGLGHSEILFLEQVWWPAFGHFRYLYPEYEVSDFKDGIRYLDFAYIRKPFKTCFEIDGYGPHARDIGRGKFSDHLIRQNHLVIDGWRVMRFSYDEVRNQPRRCQQLIQQLIGKLFGEKLDADTSPTDLSYIEREVLRYMMRKGESVYPSEIRALLGLTDKPVRKVLFEMLDKRLISATGGKQRIRSYSLGEEAYRVFLNSAI